MPDNGHTPRSRDAALRRLSRANRWLIAGSVTLTGALTAVAANAFPGRTLKTTGGSPSVAAKRARAFRQQRSGSSTGSSHALQPPAQAPQSTTTQEAAPSQEESSPSQESKPSGEASSEAPSQEATPSQESTPSQEATPSQESVPSQEATPSQESTPAQESGPVVSGGS